VHGRKKKISLNFQIKITLICQRLFAIEQQKAKKHRVVWASDCYYYIPFLHVWICILLCFSPASLSPIGVGKGIAKFKMATSEHCSGKNTASKHCHSGLLNWQQKERTTKMTTLCQPYHLLHTWMRGGPGDLKVVILPWGGPGDLKVVILPWGGPGDLKVVILPPTLLATIVRDSRRWCKWGSSCQCLNLLYVCVKDFQLSFLVKAMQLWQE
jgi:hypothetical protein